MDNFKMLKPGVYYNPLLDNFLVLRRVRKANFFDKETSKEEKGLCVTMIFHDGVLYKNVAMFNYDNLEYVGPY